MHLEAVHEVNQKPSPIGGVVEMNLKSNILMAQNEAKGYIQALNNNGSYEGQSAEVWNELTHSILEGIKERLSQLPLEERDRAFKAFEDFQKSTQNYLDTNGHSFYESQMESNLNTLLNIVT